MNHEKQIPKIRFKGFNDAWEQRKVSEIAARFDNLRIPVAASLRVPGPTPYYGANGIQDYVEGFTHEGEYVLVAEDGANDLKNYPVRYVSGRIWVNNHAHVLQSKPKTADNKFLANLISRANIECLLVGSGRAKLNAEIMMSIELYIPDIDEQRAIGRFLASLDNLITLHQRKCETLKNVKKSFLKKLFPKNGVVFPDLRFSGFTNAWEQRELKEAGSLFDYGLNVASIPFDGKNKYLRITDIDDDSRAFSQNAPTSPDTNLTLASNYRLQEGDIVFARTGATVGKTYSYNKNDGLVFFAGFLIRVRIKPEYNAEFVFQSTLTNQYKNFISITSQRSGQPGVNAQEYASFKFFAPSYKEQSQIGIFLGTLDRLITLHQRKCEALKNIKKSLLSKMFV